MIIIKSDRIIEPFGIQLSAESEFSLLAPAEQISDEIDNYDGEIDFGSTLKDGEYKLLGVIRNGEDRQSTIDYVASKFLECIDSTELKYEIKPDMVTYARIIGKPEFKPYPNFTEVVFNLKVVPFWYSVIEHILTGNGTLVNEGTFETGLIVEITGPTTNPSITIGGQVLTYKGAIPSGQRLIIDTDKETVKIGSTNAMANYNGVFPLLYPGETSVVTNNSTAIRWRDKWI